MRGADRKRPVRQINASPEFCPLSKVKASMRYDKVLISKGNITLLLHPELAQRAEMHTITR
jgi:hypothetical protein